MSIEVFTSMHPIDKLDGALTSRPTAARPPNQQASGAEVYALDNRTSDGVSAERATRPLRFPPPRTHSSRRPRKSTSMTETSLRAGSWHQDLRSTPQPNQIHADGASAERATRPPRFPPLRTHSSWITSLRPLDVQLYPCLLPL